MKVLFLGDLHGDVEIAKRIVDSVDADIVLQVGDMTVYSPFNKPVYFIAGNHEDFDVVKSIDMGSAKFDNLKHIKTAELVVFKDLRISGINGNYSPAYKEREKHFTKDDVERCKKLRGVDIFLSHEAPAGAGVTHPRRNKDVGVDPIKEIMDSVKPKILIFGHHHFYFEKRVGVTQIYGLDYARNEHYVLNTGTESIERIKTEPAQRKRL